MSEKDIAALETIEDLKNYNNYIFNKIYKKQISGKILDFGCGFGLFSKYMRDEFKLKVLGYEINESAIKKLKKENIAFTKTLNGYECTFNTVVSLNVLEHIENDLEAIKSIHKILENYGIVVFYLPHSMKIWSNLDEDVGHFRRYTKKDLLYKLKKSKFEIVSCEYVDFIGWVTLIIAKLFRISLNFDDKKIIFYDRFVFPLFKYLDIIFKHITGKNILVVARKIN